MLPTKWFSLTKIKKTDNKRKTVRIRCWICFPPDSNKEFFFLSYGLWITPRGTRGKTEQKVIAMYEHKVLMERVHKQWGLAS